MATPPPRQYPPSDSELHLYPFSVGLPEDALIRRNGSVNLTETIIDLSVVASGRR